MKTAVVYHYYEANSKYKDNFVFFLNTAILDELDYFIYISGTCTANLIKRKNIKYRYIENKNNDFGGLLEFNKEFKLVDFSTYIFINCSVRGPFVANYFQEKWYKIFSSKLSKDMLLVGSSINILPTSTKHSELFSKNYNFSPPYIHVQTAAYALSKKGYKILSKYGFFDENRQLEKNEVICRYEILMSQIFFNNGFSIGSILPTQEEFIGNKHNKILEETSNNGDLLFKSAFFGRSISPLEIVFIKTNNNTKTNDNMISNRDLASYTFTSLTNKVSKDLLTDDGLELQERSAKQLLREESITLFKNPKHIFREMKKRLKKKKRHN